jgi:hypothetical protein
LDQLIQLAISVYYNWDITNREKDKRHDLIAAPTQLGPTSRVCYQDGQEGHFCRECLRGTAWETAPPPTRTLSSAKVTTGGLSTPISRWKARCHFLWIDGSQPPVHTPLLDIDVEEPHGSHNGREVKGHFPPRQWSSFLCLTFLSGPQSNDKSYHSRQIWPAPRALVYLAFGLLFGETSSSVILSS